MAENDERLMLPWRIASFDHVKGDSVGWAVNIVFGYAVWQWQRRQLRS